MRAWTQVPPQPGRRFVITGANSGVGLAAAQILGSRGASVVLACRNLAKGRAAAATVPGIDQGRVEVRRLDVADLDSVHEFVADLVGSGSGTVDVLINNAGVLGVPLARTAQGVELHCATNYLGHYVLTNLLLPHLTDRVVVTGSREHRAGRLDLADLGWKNRPYRPYQAYCDSKLADLLFLAELDRRLRDAGSSVRAVGAHPGSTASAITSGSGHRLITAVGEFGHRLIGMPAWKGALSTVYAATMDVPGNGYIGPHGRTEMFGWPAPARRSKRAQDAGLAQDLWQVSEKLTGVGFPRDVPTSR